MQLTKADLDASTDYLRVAWCLGRERGAPQAAIKRCAQHEWRDTRADRILRAAATAGSTSDPTFARELSDYSESAGAFVAASCAPVGAFDRLHGASRKVPMHSSLVITSYGASGFEHTEGTPKGISRLSIASGTLVARTVSCTVVLNDELFRFALPIGMPLINQELGHGTERCSDAVALPALVSGLAPLDSAGSDAAAAAADAGALLAAVTFGADAQLRWIMHTNSAKALTTMLAPSGGPAFAGMSPTGGQWFGIEVLVSDELESGSSGGHALLLVDWSQLAADASVLTISSTNAALLALDDAPITGAGAILHSLFQENRVALRTERRIAIARLRDSAVAWIDNADYSAAA